MTILLLPCGARGPDGHPAKMAVDDFIVQFGPEAFRALVAEQMRPAGDAARSVEDYQQDLANRRLESIGRHGAVFFDTSPTGSGKSTADIPAMTLAGSSLTILATHKNCEEKEQELQNRGMDAAAYPCLCKDTCENYIQASRAVASGLSPSACVCPACEFRPTCPYWEAMSAADVASHRIATHRRGALFFKGIAEGREYIAIHEDPVGLLRPAVEISAQLSEVDVVTTKALDNCLKWDLPAAPYFNAMREAVRFLQDQLTQADESGQLFPPPSISTPPKADLTLLRAMEELEIWPSGDAVRVAKGIASGEVADVCIRVDRILKPGGVRSLKRSIVAFWQTSLPLNATIWIADATASADEIAAVCPLPVFDCTPAGFIEHRHSVVQIPIDIKKSTSPAVVVRTMRAVLACYPTARRIGVICDRQHIPILQGTAQKGPVLDPKHCSRIVRIEHYRSGEGRGSNLWTEQCDLLIVAGTPRVPPSAIKTRLMQVRSAGAAGRSEEWTAWGSDWWSGKTVTGRRRTIRGFGYRDHDWHSAHAAIVKAELRQCLGRGRAIRDNGIPTIVISNEDLGLELVDLDPYVATDADLAILKALRELSDLPSKGAAAGKDSSGLSDHFSKGAQEMSDRTTVLNIYILEDRSVSSSQIASRVGFCERVVRRLLNRLERAGLVERIGQRGGWRLKEAGVAQLGDFVEETAPLASQAAPVPASPLDAADDL